MILHKSCYEASKTLVAKLLVPFLRNVRQQMVVAKCAVSKRFLGSVAKNHLVTIFLSKCLYPRLLSLPVYATSHSSPSLCFKSYFKLSNPVYKLCQVSSKLFIRLVNSELICMLTLALYTFKNSLDYLVYAYHWTYTTSA